MSRHCTQCRQLRDEDEFYTRTERGREGKPRAHCVYCHAARIKRCRIDRQRAIDDLKNRPCADCKVKYNPWIMQFDHRPGEHKEYNISALRRGSGQFKKALAEAQKCDVVCANCHADRTYKRTIGVNNG